IQFLNELITLIENLNFERGLIVGFVFQVISYQRPIWRVRAGKLFISDAVTREARREAQSRSHGKHVDIALENIRGHLLDRRGVVKNNYAAPVSCQNQIVIARVNQNVMNRNVWQVL